MPRRQAIHDSLLLWTRVARLSCGIFTIKDVSMGVKHVMVHILGEVKQTISEEFATFRLAGIRVSGPFIPRFFCGHFVELVVVTS